MSSKPPSAPASLQEPAKSRLSLGASCTTPACLAAGGAEGSCVLLVPARVGLLQASSGRRCKPHELCPQSSPLLCRDHKSECGELSQVFTRLCGRREGCACARPGGQDAAARWADAAGLPEAALSAWSSHVVTRSGPLPAPCNAQVQLAHSVITRSKLRWYNTCRNAVHTSA